jgi:hypothetical protein
MIDLDVPRTVDTESLREAITYYFSMRGIGDAVYDVSIDDDGMFAIINDEAYDGAWGTPLL